MLFLTQKLLRAILQTLITNLSPVDVPLKSCLGKDVGSTSEGFVLLCPLPPMALI